MKYIEKKNLLIRENNGSYDFEYSDEITFDSRRFDDLEIANSKTKEVLKYNDLVLAISTKDVLYFYPPELYGTTKVINDYNIENWIFKADKRSKAIEDKDFRENMLKWANQTTTMLNRIGKIVTETGQFMQNSTHGMNETLKFFNGVTNPPVEQPVVNNVTIGVKK